MSRLWSGEAVAADDDFDLDIDMDEDEDDDDEDEDEQLETPLAERSILGMPADSAASLRRASADSATGLVLEQDSGTAFSAIENSGANELPAVHDGPLGDDGFAERRSAMSAR